MRICVDVNVAAARQHSLLWLSGQHRRRHNKHPEKERRKKIVVEEDG
jgi:hypothetical protein